MEEKVFISIYHDTRRIKKNGKYPVKLRVFTKIPRKQKLFPTSFEFTEKEFEAIWHLEKPRTENKILKDELYLLQKKSESIARELNPFTFEKFERKLFGSKNNWNLEYYINQIINELTDEERLNTAQSYVSTKTIISNFLKQRKRKDINKVVLQDIDQKWLKDFDNYLTGDLNRSKTTLGIYLRNLRHIFNEAISNGDLHKEFYPFGNNKNKYKIPGTTNKKKALSILQMKALINSVPKTPEQQKAVDFFLFSYNTFGTNIKDIALLKFKNIDYHNNTLEYVRAKTSKSTEDDSESIVVPLNDFSTAIIELYGRENKNPNNYVFSILQSTDTAKDQQMKIKNFNRFINQHLKIIAKDNGLPEEISFYWARHSYVSISVHNRNKSLEFIRGNLGHKNITTTQKYLNSLDIESKKEHSKTLMDF